MVGENPTYTYWHGPTLQRRMVLEWSYSVTRRNNFVGGICAPPSALLVDIFDELTFLLFFLLLLSRCEEDCNCIITGCPQITWMKSVIDDLGHSITLTEAVDVARAGHPGVVHRCYTILLVYAKNIDGGDDDDYIV